MVSIMFHGNVPSSLRRLSCLFVQRVNGASMIVLGVRKYQQDSRNDNKNKNNIADVYILGSMVLIVDMGAINIWA